MVKRDLAIFFTPEDDNKDARERKEVTMYKRLVSLYEPEQVSITEPGNERVYPAGNMFISMVIIDASPNGANPHYP